MVVDMDRINIGFFRLIFRNYLNFNLYYCACGSKFACVPQFFDNNFLAVSLVFLDHFYFLFKKAFSSLSSQRIVI